MKESKEFKFRIVAASEFNGGFYNVYSSDSFTPHFKMENLITYEHGKDFPAGDIKLQFCCDEEHNRYLDMYKNIINLQKERNVFIHLNNIGLYINKNEPIREDILCLKGTFVCVFPDIIEEINKLF
jgi:hypothetical protein